MRIRLFAAVLIALPIAAVTTAVLLPQHRERVCRNACLNNLRQLDGAGMSLCLADKLPFDHTFRWEELSMYLKADPLVCPSETAPYPPFDVLHGPRCPNSTEHNRVFVTEGCRSDRASVWAAAFSHAAARGLSWTDTVDPREIDVAFYIGKCTGMCPLGAKPYPPFVLADGPHCPYSKDHNTVQARPWRNGEFFGENGHAKTNMPLSSVDTNEWSVWMNNQRQPKH